MLTFDNRFLNELPGEPAVGNSPHNHSRQVQGAFWSRVDPTPVAAPRLIAQPPEVAAMLGLSETELQSQALVNAFSGNTKLPAWRLMGRSTAATNSAIGQANF